VILDFPRYDWYLPSKNFEKIQALPDILKEIFSKSNHIWSCNELFKTLCFTSKYLTSIVFVVFDIVSKGQFFPQKIKKSNSLHGQISIDFDMVSLKILEKPWI
jgi:hypothetical protein